MPRKYGFDRNAAGRTSVVRGPRYFRTKYTSNPSSGFGIVHIAIVCVYELARIENSDVKRLAANDNERSAKSTVINIYRSLISTVGQRDISICGLTAYTIMAARPFERVKGNGLTGKGRNRISVLSKRIQNNCTVTKRVFSLTAAVSGP